MDKRYRNYVWKVFSDSKKLGWDILQDNGAILRQIFSLIFVTLLPVNQIEELRSEIFRIKYARIRLIEQLRSKRTILQVARSLKNSNLWSVIGVEWRETVGLKQLFLLFLTFPFCYSNKYKYTSKPFLTGKKENNDN